jgi:hypothetical protein
VKKKRRKKKKRKNSAHAKFYLSQQQGCGGSLGACIAAGCLARTRSGNVLL